jgi:long-chain fatty acid transport protein
MKKWALLSWTVAAVVVVPALASATNGYLSHGVGMKAKGMGGAGVAYPQDALAAGINPAGMALIGNRFDIDLDIFRPHRGAMIVGNQIADLNGSYDANEKKTFFVPSLGYNRMYRRGVSLGVSIFGLGGMNTSYTSAIGLFGTSEAGVDFNQVFVVPTVALNVGENWAVGLGIDVAYQWLRVTGLENFDNAVYSSAPGKVTNNGNAYSYGVGIRAGWIGGPSPVLRAGLSFQSRTFMSEIDDYAGLLAESGSFDIPQQLAGGIAYVPSKRLAVVFDVAYIWYGDIKALGNPFLASGASLGDDDGPGFGWENITVYKVGAAFDPFDTWTLRAGYNHGGEPITAGETFLNMLIPAVVEDHLTLGATWRFMPGREITAAYMHAFENTVDGSASIPEPILGTAGLGGGAVNLHMYQDSFGIAFGMTF